MENLDIQKANQYTQEDFDKIKKIFEEKYTSPPFKLQLVDGDTDKNLKELIFEKKEPSQTLFPEPARLKYKILEEDLKSYIDYQRQNYKSEPFETCLKNDKYFEQSIVLINRKHRFSLPNNYEIKFKKEGIDIEISPASVDFKNHHRFSELSRIHSLWRGEVDLEFIKINDFLYNPDTIKVRHQGNLEYYEIHNLIESCLFYYTFNNKEIIWKLEEVLPKPTTFPRKEKLNYNLQGTIKKYNSKLLQYFKQGLEAENNPVYQFLSFYHVLEYFFVLVSDEKLYTDLRSIINQPNFNTVNEKNLDKIIQQIKQHRNMTDETQMLKNVLEKYITDYVKKELLDFIQNQYPFKDEKGKSWLLMNKNHDFETVFSSEKEKYQGIKTDNGHDVLGQCAIRIKTIRNALVHSSDRYERQERFIPNKHNKQLLEKEIPLIKFLAEQIIIASAE